MRAPKLFDRCLEKARSPAESEAQAFGRSDTARARFGRNGTPYFGGLADLAKNQRGVAMIEYAIICAVIALAVVAGVTQLGGGVADSWGNVDNSVGNAVGPFSTGYG
jgi:Flp pilus assembly pilin Flp